MVGSRADLSTVSVGEPLGAPPGRVHLPAPRCIRREQDMKLRNARLLLLMAAVATLPSAAWSQEQVVRLGDLLAISNIGIYAASEKGYFKEQGIRNEVTTFASAAKMPP